MTACSKTPAAAASSGTERTHCGIPLSFRHAALCCFGCGKFRAIPHNSKSRSAPTGFLACQTKSAANTLCIREHFCYSCRKICKRGDASGVSRELCGVALDLIKGAMTLSKNKTATVFAISAAALYAINVPLSKLLLINVSPRMLAGFLYLGAGVGIGVLLGIRKTQNRLADEQWLDKKDLPYTIAMIGLDIAAPIFLMLGIANTNSANVSLINNFEIVATSVIALVIFKEKISRRLWAAIILVMLSSAILGFEGTEAFVFNKGSLFVLCACICWGVENNCTRSISDKSSEEIVLVKGIFSGIGSILIAFIVGEKPPEITYMLAAMLLGFVSYGLSINFYIMAQKNLGAAKTSAFYSVAPFLGVGFSFIILGERPTFQFYIALGIMIISTLLMIKDTLGNEKLYNGYVHIHQHKHGRIVHTHEHRHFVYNPMHIHNHSHAG